MTGSVLTGTVMHERLAPPYRFEHQVCFYELDLDHIAVLDAGSRLFGYNRSRPLSLHDRDHIGDPARSIRENLDAALAEPIRELGMTCVFTDTIMSEPDVAAALAATTLATIQGRRST